MRFAASIAAVFALALCPAPDAAANVVGSGPTGFEVQEAVRIAAPPARVWATLTKPGDWWNSEHSYSHNSQNMTITATAGGCFCEKWAGGSVEHMRVVYVVPGKVLKMEGGLGPLQDMGVAGVMSFTLTATIDGGTAVTLNYAVGGYSARGFDGLAKAVDGVLAEQMNRMQLFIQTGSPIARATQ